MDRHRIKTLGKEIRKKRLEMNFTQAELVGVDWTTIGHLERGGRQCNLFLFFKICQILRLNPGKIFQDLDFRKWEQNEVTKIKNPFIRRRKPQKRHLL